MGNRLYVQKLLEMSEQYQPDLSRNLNRELEYTPFEGIPQKHPHDSGLLILIDDSKRDAKHFYQLQLESIGKIEDLGSISNSKGENLVRIRVWVKKGTTAIRSETFTVS